MDWTNRLAEALRPLAIEVAEVRPLHGGACQENFAVVAADGRRFALRSDANQSLPGSIDRSTEAAFVALAVERGVRTPAVREVFDGLLRPGASAYLMDWAEGVAIGAKVQRDPRLAEAREGLIAELAHELARIHSIRPDDAPSLRPGSPHDALADDAVSATLRFSRTMLDGLPPRPAMERIFAWLEANRPAPGPVVLVHGDYRVGNFLVTPAGLSAVLDWEFAHWGAAENDIAWLTVRDWRFGRPGLAVGGLGTRAAFLEAYRQAGGVAVDPGALRWFEVAGSLRWGAAALYQAQRTLTGAESDFELLAIGRRAVEMEWEALRVMGALPDAAPSLPKPSGPASIDTPDAPALAAGVAGFLQGDVLPAISDRGLAFRVRIAAHLSGILAREAVQGEAFAEADRAALVDAGLVDSKQGPARAAVLAGRAALARAIRAGDPPEGADTLLCGMLARQLTISNPRFSLERDLGEDPWTS